MYVLGKLGRASFLDFAELISIGLGLMELVEGATRYARPCRPVKPLDIIWEESARSAAHLAQRRWEVWPPRSESESGGLVLAALSMESLRQDEALLSTLDCRLRKGREGTRYVGNSAGGDGRDGKGMLGYFPSRRLSLTLVRDVTAYLIVRRARATSVAFLRYSADDHRSSTEVSLVRRSMILVHTYMEALEPPPSEG